MEAIVSYMLMQQMYKFKAKVSEKKTNPLWLGNISKYFTVYNMKKTGLKGSFLCWL